MKGQGGLTQGLDDRGTLKDGVGDVGLLEEGSQHETSQTSSDDKNSGFVA